MILALFDFQCSRAAEAALPGLPLHLLLLFNNRFGHGVPRLLRALGLVVPRTFAGHTNLGPAAATPALPAPVFTAHALPRYRLAAAPCRAQEAAAVGVLLVLLVPFLLERRVKKVLNSRNRNVVGGTAPRWHVFLRVVKRALEYFADTRMAHAMAAFQFNGRAHGGSVIPAKHAYGGAKAAESEKCETRVWPFTGQQVLTARLVCQSALGG